MMRRVHLSPNKSRAQATGQGERRVALGVEALLAGACGLVDFDMVQYAVATLAFQKHYHL
jgi:hypothetical protein